MLQKDFAMLMNDITGDFHKVKVMASCDGYSMVRRPRCAPFVTKTINLKPLTKQER